MSGGIHTTIIQTEKQGNFINPYVTNDQLDESTFNLGGSGIIIQFY